MQEKTTDCGVTGSSGHTIQVCAYCLIATAYTYVYCDTLNDLTLGNYHSLAEQLP